MRRIKTSCVVPAYNEEPYLARTLRILAKMKLFTEIVVVDDFSGDKTRSIIQKECLKYSNMKLVANSKNLGKAGAVEVGIKHSKSQIICVVDADILFLKKDWIEKAIKELKTGVFKMVILERGGDKISPFVFVNKTLGGERIFWRSDYFKAKVERSLGYGFEPSFNDLFIKRGLRIKTIYCKELYAATHFNDRGFVAGIRHYFKVVLEVFKAVGVCGVFKHVFFVEKDGLDKIYELYYSYGLKLLTVPLIVISDFILTILQLFQSLIYAFRNRMFSKYY